MLNTRLFKPSLLFLFIVCAGQVFAQDTSNTIGQVNIASPTAASLGKYGDIPVSYHTGIPQISIPIYTIKSGQLSLPISLSYHAGGLKVQEQASWVGAGFSLNAGGAIIRTVIGAPDDRGYNTTTNSYVEHGYYSDYGFQSYIYESGGYDEVGITHGTKDGEPDLYFFNFGGYTGKFYFNDDRTPILVPEADFKIQPDYRAGSGFAGFVITTPDGVKYYFGKTGNSGAVAPIESTIPSTLASGPASSGAAASSWFLNKIVSAEGTDSITFNYQQEKYSYYTISMHPEVDYQYNMYDAGHCGYAFVKNFVDGVRLSQINFANGQVLFNKAASPRADLSSDSTAYSDFTDVTNTSAYALGSISITDNNGFCKKDSLFYSYFHSGTALQGVSATAYSAYNLHSDTSRLRLDSLQESTCNGVTALPPYKFDYYTDGVPRNLSFGFDHWGYYNGHDDNYTVVPTYKIIVAGAPETHGGANRDPSWPEMRGGALHSLTYPLGGKTTFDFESHDTYGTATGEEPFLDFLISRGYDGNHSAVTDTMTATGRTYTVRLVNTTDQEVRVAVTGPNHSTVVDFIYISPHTTNDSTTKTYPAELLYFDFSWTTTPGTGAGYGAQVFFSHYETVTNYYNLPIGGLRIKTVSSNDANTTNDIVTSYTYTNGSNGGYSSGILYSRPVYVQVLRNDVYGMVWPYCTTGCASCDGLGAHTYYISGGSIRPMATTQGNHIGYNEVAVSQIHNGKKIYRFYGSNIWSSPILTTAIVTNSLIQDSLCSSGIPNYPAAPLPFEFKRGDLYYDAAFDSAGHIMSEAYHFPVYQTDPLTTPGHLTTNLPAFNVFTDYSLQSAYKVEDSTIAFLYQPGTSNAVRTISKTYYGSQYHHQPTRTVSSTSTGDSLATDTKYAFDFRVNGCDAIPDSLPYYNAKLSSAQYYLVSHIDICSPQVNSSSNCRSFIYQYYRDSVRLARVSFINYRRRSFADSTGLQASCYADTLGAADALLRPILRLQKEYKNVPIETSSWRNLRLLGAAFTRYDTSINPVGFAYAGKSQAISLAVSSTVFSNAAVSGASISRDSRYADEALFKFDKGNPAEVTAKNGVTTSYLWDYRHELPIAKVVNADTASIAYTSFEADGSGNWIIGSSARDTTTALTGRKSYNLSNGAIRKYVARSDSYVLSLWTKGGFPSITIHPTGGTPSLSFPVPLYQSSVNGWTNYQYTISLSDDTLVINGTGVIDELRLYPKAAQMTSYTYDPMVGMSSADDPAGLITYYDYDGLARLKNIKDYQGNIVKNYQYNYLNSCGDNCVVMQMQTFVGTNTLSYPVGVFNVNGRLLGNATSQSAYITLWMSDTANSHIGTLTAGSDSMHFHLALNTGRYPPSAVTGLRYYQVDLAYTQIDAIRNTNGAYVDFGDSTGMRLGKTVTDTAGLVLPPNTVINMAGVFPYIIHTYASSAQKTITLYHNDSYNFEAVQFDNRLNPATSLTMLKNLRGYIPQYNARGFSGSSSQDSTYNTVANIVNWNGITSIVNFSCNPGDGVSPWKNMRFAQDFMQNNRGLTRINTIGYNYYSAGYRDSTFKISRLKSGWNTYFTAINELQINDEHWNREDLSALIHLKTFAIIAGNQLHSNDTTGNAVVPIPSSAIDNIFNQISSGAGHYVTGGSINIMAGGNDRTSASDAAVADLLSKGWTIYINGVQINP